MVATHGRPDCHDSGQESRVAIRPIDRPAYVAALQAAQAGEGPDAFDRLMAERLVSTLEEFLLA